MRLIDVLQLQDGFSEVEKKIADFIISHRDDAKAMTIGQLSDAAYASKSSVVRLCKKLDCDGYREFMRRFNAELEHTNEQREDMDFNYPFSQNEGVAGIVRSTIKLYQETAEICFEHLSREKVARAAEWIAGARKLYLYGVGDTYISLLSFANQLTKLGIVSVQPLQFNENISVTDTATSEDVAIFASYSGDLVKERKKELWLLKRKRCRIILISSLPGWVDANLLLHIPPKENIDGKISVFYSQTAFHIIYSCLYGIIYGKDYERYREQKRQQEIFSNI